MLATDVSWRAAIGRFYARSSSKSADSSCSVIMGKSTTSGYRILVLCVVLCLLDVFTSKKLLIIGGVELNPGPPKPTPPSTNSGILSFFTPTNTLSRSPILQPFLTPNTMKRPRSESTPVQSPDPNAISPLSDLEERLTANPDGDVGESLRILINLQRTSTTEIKDCLSSVIQRLDAFKFWTENTDVRINNLTERVVALESSLSNQIQSPSVNVTTETIQDMKRQNVALLDKVDDLENRERRNNLIIHGIPEKTGESWNDTELIVSNFCRDTLDVCDLTFERVHRLGKPSPGKKRPIICRLLNFKDKDRIRRCSGKLKDSPVSISDDFSVRVRSIRSKLRDFGNKNRQMGDQMRINFDKLLLNGKTFIYNRLLDRVVPQCQKTGGRSAGDSADKPTTVPPNTDETEPCHSQPFVGESSGHVDETPTFTLN